MLKRHQIVLGFLSASAIWATLFVLQSDTSAFYQICEANQYTNQEKCTPHHLLYVVFWYVNSNTITAFATGVIACFTGTIWVINRSQLRHAHKVERAYMSVGGTPARRNVEIFSSATGVSRITTELTGHFEVHINNHGKTPGELMHIAIEFCDSENIPSPPIYNPQPFHDWIGPGTQSRPMDWREIPTDTPATAVYGRIFYRDIFGDDHFSGFIQILLPDGGTAPLLAPPVYTASN